MEMCLAENVRPRDGLRAWIQAQRTNWRVQVLAVGFGLGLWLVFVLGKQVSQERIRGPMVIDHVPVGFVIVFPVRRQEQELLAEKMVACPARKDNGTLGGEHRAIASSGVYCASHSAAVTRTPWMNSVW